MSEDIKKNEISEEQLENVSGGLLKPIILNVGNGISLFEQIFRKGSVSENQPMEQINPTKKNL